MAKFGDWVVRTPLHIIFVVVVAYLLNRLSRRAIRRFTARIEGSASSGRLKRMRERTPSMLLSTGEVNMRSAARARTIGAVLRSLTTAIIWAFAFVYVLNDLGFNLGPLLAGAGVVGVALGFGSQSLVRDFLSGMFMLIEDQYGVGDIIDVGLAAGVVEEVSLRTTRFRDINGTVWHVPNGQIQRVGNRSQQWARAVLDVAVAPKNNAALCEAVILTAAKEVWADDQWANEVLEEPEVLGVEYLGPDAMAIRVIGKTRPGSQFTMSRVLRARVAAALDEAGIERPEALWTRAGTPPPA